MNQAAPLSKKEGVKSSLRHQISTGVLLPGSRVPSLQALAHELQVSKNTAIAALEELCSEGLLEAQERRGFFVRKVKAHAVRARSTRLAELQLDHTEHGMASILVPGPDEQFVSVGGGCAPASLLATPEWSAMLKSHPPRDSLSCLRYADPLGEPRLREAISGREGLVSDKNIGPDQILVTHGAVEALNLCLGFAVAHTGIARVAVESPGYYMLKPMLDQLGIEVIGVPRSEAGLDVEALHNILRGQKIAAFVVNPNHQNPLGTTLSLSDRFSIAAAAETHGFLVIEDEVYRGLWLDAEEPPSVSSFIPRRSFFVGSFSKTLGPGLRIGYVVCPQEYVSDMRRRKFVSTLSGDAYTQNLVAEFLEKRGYQKHLFQLRAEIRRKGKIAQVQAQEFAHMGAFAGPFAGGFFQRFVFSAKIDVMSLYQEGKSRGILLAPGCFYEMGVNSAGQASGPGNSVQRNAPWMRVNVTNCEGSALTTALRFVESSSFL